MSLLTPVALPSRQDRLGTVLTDTTQATPVVYTKTTTDDLLTAKAGTAELDAVATTAEDAAEAAEEAFDVAGEAHSLATSAAADAATATAAANAAIAAAASFPVADFLGTITTLADDPGTASTRSGKWWQIGVAGLLTHVNAGGLTVAIGDRLLSNGTVWLKYVTPPTYLPDGSVLREKMESAAQDQWGRLDAIAGHAFIIKDTLDRVGLAIRDDGTIVGKLGVEIGVPNGLSFTYGASGLNTLSLGTVEGMLPLGTGSLDSTNGRADIAFVILDSAGKEAFRIKGDGTTVIQKLSAPSTGVDSEVVTARGTRSALDVRLDASLTEHGLPKDGWWGLVNLRETRQRFRKLSMGEASRLTILLIGDSWTQNYARYSYGLTSILRSAYGDAGIGWVGFSWPPGTPSLINGSVDPFNCSVTTTGSWVPIYGTSTSPDIGHISTSGVGDKVTVTGPASCSAVILYHLGGGEVRYRWNAGAWTNLVLSGSVLQQASLAGVPVGTWTLEIEVVSGVPILCGIDVQKSTNGVRVHKVAATGSRTSQWAAVDATQWQSGITALAPNLVIVLHGTNDQAAYAPATYRTHLGTILTRVRTAAPTADILLVAPCENNRTTNTWPMVDYQEQAYQTAEEYHAGFLNLQPLFGINPADYSAISARPWFNPDLVHPEPASGGRAIIDALVRALTVT